MLFIVSGPSGSGKATLISNVMTTVSNLRLPVSYTTRPKRNGEVNGTDYHFISKEEFQRKIDAGEFIEWMEVFGNGHFYGTPIEELSKNDGRDVLLEIDTRGAVEIKMRMPWAITIFILPPSPAELALRIMKRARGESDEEIKARLKTAMEEVSRASMFEYWIENKELYPATSDLAGVITSLRHLKKCQDKQLLSRAQQIFSASA